MGTINIGRNEHSQEEEKSDCGSLKIYAGSLILFGAVFREVEREGKSVEEHFC